MTDELVKRLRGWDHCWPAPWLERAVAEAADRIEQLTAEREALEQDNHRWKMDCENFWRDREKTLIAERDEAWAYMSALQGDLYDAVRIEAERDRLRAALSILVIKARAALKGESHE